MIESFSMKHPNGFCNKCGKILDNVDREASYAINGRIGYGSKYDGEDFELNLCCDCMDNLIDSCLITPLKIKS